MVAVSMTVWKDRHFKMKLLNMIDFTTPYYHKIGRFGLTINNLSHGKGFSLYIGNLLVWHQAWFGKLNDVHWHDGKFLIISSYFNFEYSQRNGYKKID